jgi:hypothetical protein
LPYLKLSDSSTTYSRRTALQLIQAARWRSES